MKKTTLKQFLDNYHKKEKLLMINYNSLWGNIVKDEAFLVKNGIIEILDNGKINNKIYVLDSKNLALHLENKLQKRKKSIRNFIRETEIKYSYSTIYAFIVNNREKLKKNKIINITKDLNSRSTIEILDFDKFKMEIEKK